MTIPPLTGGGLGVPPFRTPVLTAPVSTGIPPLVTEDDVARPRGAPAPAAGGAGGNVSRDDAPISLGGRLESGDLLPDTTELAVALESATRAMQHGRADQVLTLLDTVWSSQLASDSPWYLRAAALQLLRRTSDAEQVLRDAIARLPRSAAMLYLLGVHTMARGQTEAARLANDHALALHPTEPLLWLQRAALAQRSAMPETAAALLEHVESMAPGYPAADWLARLSQLGEHAGHDAPPVVAHTTARLTPGSLPPLGESTAPPHHGPAPLASGVLESVLRYGLTLLESPTQSARSATYVATPIATSRYVTGEYASMIAGTSSIPPSRAPLPAWDTVMLVTGALIIAFVPSLRIPALMLCGAAAMLIVSRRL